MNKMAELFSKPEYVWQTDFDRTDITDRLNSVKESVFHFNAGKKGVFQLQLTKGDLHKLYCVIDGNSHCSIRAALRVPPTLRLSFACMYFLVFMGIYIGIIYHEYNFLLFMLLFAVLIHVFTHLTKRTLIKEWLALIDSLVGVDHEVHKKH